MLNLNILLTKYLTLEIFIIFLFIIIFFVLLYNLHNKTKNDNYIENFSNLKKLKKNNSKNNSKISKNNSKISKNNFQNIPKSNSNKSISFDYLMKKSEALAKKHNSQSSFLDSINKYRKSFNHAKFKNNSKNTAEAFEKFSLYKDKFFEIFK
jgi:hypothetical protein